MGKKPSHQELEQSVKNMEPGNHLCFIYKTEKEHQALLTTFMRQGLKRDEKVLYIADAHTGEEVINYLRDDGMAVEHYLESGQLVIITANEAYIRDGVFDPDAMIELLRDETERSLEEGYSALRVTGEMTWSLKGLRGSERLIEYEAKFNEFFANSKCLAICQYDKRRFEPKLLSDVLATHPIAVIGTEVFNNFYYVPPKDLLSPDPATAKLDKRLNSLLELKQAGKALYESEEKYRKLFEEARDGIFLADAETGIIVDCNYEATRLIERDKSELIGQHQRILHPPSQGNGKFSETFQKHLKESEGQVLETQVITSTGEVKEVAIKANLLHVGNRELIQGIFSDITERKRAEESLKLFRALIERSNDAIEVVDPKTGHFLDVNEKGCADLGYSREEFLSLRVSDIDPNMDLSSFTDVLMKDLRKTGFLSEERLHLRKDGTTFPVEINMSYVQLDRDYLVTVVRDITERKGAEESLKLFRALIERSNDAIEVVDPKTGHFLDVNEKGCADLGYSREEFLSLRVSDIDPNTDLSSFTEILMEDLRKTGSLSEERIHLRKDGTTFPVEINLSYVQLDRDYLVNVARDITERTQAIEKLRKSENFLNDIFESIQDGLSVLNPDLTIRRVNSIIKEWYEKALPLEGKKCHECYQLRNEPCDPCPTLRCFQSGQTELEIVPGLPGSSVEWIELFSFPIKDRDSGKVTGAVEFVRDITERKGAERAIRESEKKYRTILENIEEGYYETDVKGNFTFFNDSMCKISGYTRDELMGMNNRDFLTPETAKKVYKTFNKIYQTGKPARIVGHELIKKDGSEISIEASASLIRDSKDKPVGFRGIIRDVTEEKKIEGELIQTKNFLQNIFDSSAEGITTTDLHGKIIYMSPRIKDILGYDQEELIGKKVYSLYSNGKEDAKAIMKALTEKGELRSHEIRFIRKDGRLVDINVSASFLKNETGETIGTLGIYSDTTKEKKLDAQLQQAQKMEAIGTLAGGVAHDFNNILTTIIGNAELMLMTVDRDESLRMEIEEIKTAGKRGAALTRQLLAFSRKQIIQPKILDLNALLANIEKMLIRLIGENIEILMVPESGLWQVEIDPGQMEQAIMNLAVNAKDAMPNGGKLTIQTANTDLAKDHFVEHGIVEEQPGSYVMVAVSDNGSGMGQETQKHIFEPFYSTKEKGKGTGLGLSTVYGIVKQNSGFIWVSSEPGQGSTFKIYLPRVKESVKTEEKEQNHVESLTGSETVLVVEDNVSLLNFAQKALRQYGYKVLTAKSGEDALRISEEYDGSIDLLITDVVMPTMSGKETAERLQMLCPQMKVIYISGYTDDAIVHLGVLEPGLNFLEKPFSPEVLASKIREVLET